MKQAKNQAGSAHIVIAVVITVLLLGAVGYIFWQNFMVKKEGPAQQVSTQQPEKKKQEESTKQEEKTEKLPDLIDYGKDGVLIEQEADLAKLTNASDSFKTFVWNEIERNSRVIETSDGPMGCNADIRVRKLYKQSYAEGSFGTACGPSYLQVWGNVDGGWKVVAGAHATWYMCEALRQYKVPSIIVDNKCFQAGGEVEYQQQ